MLEGVAVAENIHPGAVLANLGVLVGLPHTLRAAATDSKLCGPRADDIQVVRDHNRAGSQIDLRSRSQREGDGRKIGITLYGPTQRTAPGVIGVGDDVVLKLERTEIARSQIGPGVAALIERRQQGNGGPADGRTADFQGQGRRGARGWDSAGQRAQAGNYRMLSATALRIP